MKTSPKMDNRTRSQKIMLRQTALSYLRGATPVVCETHGGRGDIYAALYTGIADGVVFEIAPERAEALAAQRPTWAVYQADVEIALAAGAGAHLEVNYLDVDPYGSSWETLEAFFASRRPRPARLVVVVHDGLRLKASSGAAWSTARLAPFVARYGNHRIWREYPTRICRELMDAVTAPAGYAVRVFESYATGHEQKMVHMLAVLERAGGAG